MELAGPCKAEEHNGWLLCTQIDDQFRQLMSGTEADPMVVHFADIPRIMVSPYVSACMSALALHDDCALLMEQTLL